MLGRYMGQWPQGAENGGVTDQHVEPAETLVERGSERIDGFAVTEVERNERGLAALRPDLIVDLFQRLVCAREQQHVSALAGESERDGAADAARGAGDKRDTVLEPE
jgi:hypothetical protein